MKIKNKIISVLFIIFCLIALVACSNNSNNQQPEERTPYSTLKVLSVNDVHGHIESNEDTYAMSGLSWYANKQRSVKGQAVLLLSAGDMFQGTAISNYSFGINVVELMNDMDFKAMTIGNHEFDWGIETIMGYEKSFPYLACNIMKKADDTLIDGVEPYTIVDFNEFQVGIIGYIGVGLESDIAASRVSDYYFADPVNDIAKYAKELHVKGCELVIAMGHDASDGTNSKIAGLSGDEAVDMIINGHTHVTYTRSLRNGNSKLIPISQAGTACEYFTETIFDFDSSAKQFDEYRKCSNISLGSYEIEEDASIKAKVAKMSEAIAPIMKEQLASAGNNVNRVSVGSWVSDQILKNIDCDLACINSGGIRASAFPIRNGQIVTVEKVYEISPFDNAIKKATFTGSELTNILKITDIVTSTNVHKNDIDGFTINGVDINYEKTYTVAFVDYLYDRDSLIYEHGKDVEIINYLVRDIIIDELRILGQNNTPWLD